MITPHYKKSNACNDDIRENSDNWQVLEMSACSTSGQLSVEP